MASRHGSIPYWVTITVLLQIFWLPSVRHLGWGFWFWAFATASMLDVASTYYVVHIRHVSWYRESNPVVQRWGPIMGFDLVFAVWNIVMMGVAYAIGRIVEAGQGELVYAMFFWVMVFFRIAAAFSNLFSKYVDISFLFHY